MTKNRVVAGVLALASFIFAFWGVGTKLVSDWSTDDNYSHGFLMVPLACYVAYRQRDQLAAIPLRPSVAGLGVILVSQVMLGAGTLGVELFMTRMAALVALIGIVWFLCGFGHVKALAFVFVLLLLAIPIPAIIFNQIAFPLQLLASRFGVLAISACQIPVLREGNVIVLASTTLEVAEACSGIRSLMSLVALAAVWGYLSGSSLLVRWILVIAALPIAIFANGVRVGGTGIAAHFIGPEAAEGFFHSFSGWLVFIVAGALLFSVHRLATWLLPAGRGSSTDAGLQAEAQVPARADGRSPSPTRAIVVAACLVAAALALRMATRTEVTPLREPLGRLPLSIGGWTGRDAAPFNTRVLETLKVDEYLNRTYVKPGAPGVGLYIGYYASQRQGQTMHSPMNCMPGSGWEPVERNRLVLNIGGEDGTARRAVEVNEIIVQNGLDHMRVLYWYQAHGRVVASEYWGKIYTVIDAIRLNRSDGSMIRIIVPVDSRQPNGHETAAQAALDFARGLFPVLGRYLPE